MRSFQKELESANCNTQTSLSSSGFRNLERVPGLCQTTQRCASLPVQASSSSPMVANTRQLMCLTRPEAHAAMYSCEARRKPSNPTPESRGWVVTWVVQNIIGFRMHARVGNVSEAPKPSLKPYCSVRSQDRLSSPKVPYIPSAFFSNIKGYCAFKGDCGCDCGCCCCCCCWQLVRPCREGWSDFRAAMCQDSSFDTRPSRQKICALLFVSAFTMSSWKNMFDFGAVLCQNLTPFAHGNLDFYGYSHLFVASPFPFLPASRLLSSLDLLCLCFFLLPYKSGERG